MNQTDESIMAGAAKLAAEDAEAIVSVFSTQDERCLYASPSHERILGYSPLEMLGKHWREVVAPEDHAHADLAGADALLTGSSVEFGFLAATKSGGRVPLRGIAWIQIGATNSVPYLFFRALVGKVR